MRIIFLMLLLLSAPVFAATIHGSVYNFDLSIAGNTVVEINTQPKQQMVAKDGSYSFTVPRGQYVISAGQIIDGESIASTSESIFILTEGDFVLDLILFPSFESDEVGLTDEDLDLVESAAGEDAYFKIYLLALAVAAAVFIILKKIISKKGREPSESMEFLDDITAFIKKEGGRASQKDIRKAFPHSEAKISMALTELEHKGIIEKIKKGRGNIVILK